jgi:hypothetical protein
VTWWALAAIVCWGVALVPQQTISLAIIFRKIKNTSQLLRGVFVRLAWRRLLGNLSHHTSTNGAAAFADGEGQALVHGDWSE